MKVEIIEELIRRIVASEDKKICTMHKIFRDISEELMNGYVLEDGKTEIELVEIEYYFHMCDEHEDPFIHASIKQICTSGELYFHSKGRGGVDITFGNHENNIIGGILLKSAKINGEYCVGQTEVKKRVDPKYELKKAEKKNDYEKILVSRRVGLKTNDTDEKEKKEFALAPYRFVRNDLLKMKDKKKRKNLRLITELEAMTKLRNEDKKPLSSYEKSQLEKYKKFGEDCFKK